MYEFYIFSSSHRKQVVSNENTVPIPIAGIETDDTLAPTAETGIVVVTENTETPVGSVIENTVATGIMIGMTIEIGAIKIGSTIDMEIGIEIGVEIINIQINIEDLTEAKMIEKTLGRPKTLDQVKIFGQAMILDLVKISDQVKITDQVKMVDPKILDHKILDHKMLDHKI